MTDISEKFGWNTTPYDGEVNGAELLASLTKLFDDHLILPTGASTAMALWAINSYVYQVGSYLPKLLISSPTRGCGKTTAQRLLGKVCNRSILSSNMTKATVFRAIEKHSPTLLVDEADTFFFKDDELFGILNAGHSKESALVWRCVKDDQGNFDIQPFNVYSPQVIGMIGHPKNDAFLSRCIVINMIRRAQDERIQAYNAESSIFAELRGKLQKWASDNEGALKELRPITLDSGDDRYDNNWEPLLGIASLCEGEWLAKAKLSAQQLNHLDMEEALGTMLLEDIRGIFATEKVDRLPSKNIVKLLLKLSDRPWKDLQNGRFLDERSLSKLLKPFSISPKTVRVGEGTVKGYMLEQFEDAFRRYLR